MLQAVVALLLALCAISWPGPSMAAAIEGETIVLPKREFALDRAENRSNEGEAVTVNGRKVFPFSVVPGGFKDRQEFRTWLKEKAKENDLPPGFDVDPDQVIFEVLREDLCGVYVEFSVDGEVRSPRKPTCLRKGETVIKLCAENNNCTLWRRARCGNRTFFAPIELSTGRFGAFGQGFHWRNPWAPPSSPPVVPAVNAIGTWSFPSHGFGGGISGRKIKEKEPAHFELTLQETPAHFTTPAIAAEVAPVPAPPALPLFLAALAALLRLRRRHQA